MRAQTAEGVALRSHMHVQMPRPRAAHHALAGVDDSWVAGDDGAEALLHVAHQQRCLGGREPADAARRRRRRCGARGHGAHCTGASRQAVRTFGLSLKGDSPACVFAPLF